MQGRKLRHFDQAPSFLGKRRRIGLFVSLNGNELAIETVTPAVIGTVKVRGMPFIVTADLHAAVAAGVEKDADFAASVPRQNDGLFAHTRDEKVARLFHLALVTDVKPRPAENTLLFLLVDFLIDEDLPADFAFSGIHKGPQRSD